MDQSHELYFKMLLTRRHGKTSITTKVVRTRGRMRVVGLKTGAGTLLWSGHGRLLAFHPGGAWGLGPLSLWSRI